MFYAGIDVGKSGAFAIMKDEYLINYGKYEKQSFINAMYYLSKQQEKTRVCIEKVHAMPKQGSVSMFSFGENFGWLKGVMDALEISYQEVKPQVWKKEFNLNSNKEDSVEVARRLFPEANLIPERCRKEDHNIAEAIIMAEYARRKL